ncbi:MAG: hypothetical protein ACKOUR_01900 [Planctomycetota bacterium]
MEALLVLLLAVHLLCANVASVAPLLTIWWERLEARGDALAGQWGRSLLWHSILLLLIAFAIGLLLGWQHWSAEYAVAVQRLQNKIWFAVVEFIFSLLLLLVQVIWWSRSERCSRAARVTRSIFALLASTNLLYHFPVLMVILSQLTASVELSTEAIEAAEFRQRLLEPGVLARCVHIWLASIAVTGGWLIAWSCWQGRPVNDQDPRSRRAIWGARLALIPSLLQIPVGVWLLVTLPAFEQSRVLGADITISVIFGFSVLLAMWLLHLLAAISFGDTRLELQVRTVVVLVLVVMLMTAVLRKLNSPLGPSRPESGQELLERAPPSAETLFSQQNVHTLPSSTVLP